MTLIRVRRSTKAQWQAKNSLLDSGEPGYEVDTGRFKIGNGFSKWNDLDYYIPFKQMFDVITEPLLEPIAGIIQPAEFTDIDGGTPFDTNGA